jgi:hypothetical protein
MAEPPASWDQQEEDTSALSLAASKFANLNVNATEFVPSFGTGFSSAAKVPAAPPSTTPKTPPSTPVIPRNTIEEEKKQTETVINNTSKAIELNNQQEIKEQITTAEGYDDDLLDDENEG